jgi:DNA-directed RNA polymerase specialized sigma24 family protein
VEPARVPTDLALPAAVVAEESALVERVQRGDSAAFDVLVRRYIRRAFTVAFRLLSHREDAEDLVQETFMILLHQIDDFELGRRLVRGCTGS